MVEKAKPLKVKKNCVTKRKRCGDVRSQHDNGNREIE